MFGDKGLLQMVRRHDARGGKTENRLHGHCMMSSRIRRLELARRGFTLIELLVVVAIIVILIAILLPSLGAARKQAKAVKCGANLREWGIVMSMYRQEYDDLLPVHSIIDVGGAYWWGWFDYFRNTTYDKGILFCPEVQPPAPGRNLVHYGMNRNFTSLGNIWPKSRFWRFRQVEAPHDYVLLGDGWINPTWMSASSGLQPYVGAASEYVDLRHHDTANILFGDGHVEACSRSKVTKAYYWKTSH